jgi:hypothetical protein
LVAFTVCVAIAESAPLQRAQSGRRIVGDDDIGVEQRERMLTMAPD